MTQPLNQVRAWILGAGLAGLCAGMAVGWAVPRAIEAWLPGDPADGNAATLKFYAEKYSLTRDQRRQISMVLDSRDRDMLKEYRKYAQSLPAALKTHIMDTRRHADERIYAVLSEGQQQLYLQDLTVEFPK